MKGVIFWAMVAFIVLHLLLLDGSLWHRQPVTFYEPLIFPVEVISGDVIVLENGVKFAIDEDKRINSISYGTYGTEDTFTVNATVKRSLWQLMWGAD